MLLGNRFSDFCVSNYWFIHKYLCVRAILDASPAKNISLFSSRFFFYQRNISDTILVRGTISRPNILVKWLQAAEFPCHSLFLSSYLMHELPVMLLVNDMCLSSAPIVHSFVKSDRHQIPTMLLSSCLLKFKTDIWLLQLQTKNSVYCKINPACLMFCTLFSVGFSFKWARLWDGSDDEDEAGRRASEAHRADAERGRWGCRKLIALKDPDWLF